MTRHTASDELQAFRYTRITFTAENYNFIRHLCDRNKIKMVKYRCSQIALFAAHNPLLFASVAFSIYWFRFRLWVFLLREIGTILYRRPKEAEKQGWVRRILNLIELCRWKEKFYSSRGQFECLCHVQLKLLHQVLRSFLLFDNKMWLHDNTTPRNTVIFFHSWNSMKYFNSGHLQNNLSLKLTLKVMIYSFRPS